MPKFPTITGANLLGAALCNTPLGFIPFIALGALNLKPSFYNQIYTGYQYAGYINIGISTLTTLIVNKFDINFSDKNKDSEITLKPIKEHLNLGPLKESLKLGSNLIGAKAVNYYFDNNKIDASSLVCDLAANINQMPNSYKTVAPYVIGAGVLYTGISYYSLIAFDMNKAALNNGFRYAFYLKLVSIAEPKIFETLEYSAQTIIKEGLAYTAASNAFVAAIVALGVGTMEGILYFNDLVSSHTVEKIGLDTIAGYFGNAE